MPRPLRIEFDGAWYHVMNRGARKREIFHDDHDRLLFLSLLGDIKEIWNVEVHAYSLMDNHFHLLLHTPNSNLSRSMKHLCASYAAHYNKKYSKDGALLRGRFKSILVEKGDYLLALVRYIHMNPVKAGLSQVPEKHPWTSHGSYLGIQSSPDFLIKVDILSEFGRPSKSARKQFDGFVKSGEDSGFIRVINSKKRVNILGSEGFRDWIKYNFLNAPHRDVALPTMRANRRTLPPDDKILKYILAEYRLDEDTLKTRRRGNDAKIIYIYLLRYVSGVTYSQIAKLLGMNPTAVAKTLQRIKQPPNSDLLERAQAYRRALVSYVKV